MDGRPKELIKTDRRMHHNQANHKHAKYHEMCCDFFYDVLPLSSPHPRAYCPPGRGLVVGYLYPRALPPVTHGSALQAPECLRFVFLPRIERIGRIVSCGRTIRSKSLLLSPGLRLCSLMRMLSHVSELPCLTLHIRLVCPQADRKATKQNSCRRQYKMSLHRRLLTITLDL